MTWQKKNNYTHQFSLIPKTIISLAAGMIFRSVFFVHKKYLVSIKQITYRKKCQLFFSNENMWNIILRNRNLLNMCSNYEVLP